MFAATCKGKDGRLWSIHLPVDTWEDAWNIIKQLGLEVREEDLGLLVEHGKVEDLSDFMQACLGAYTEPEPEPLNVVVSAHDSQHKKKVH